MFRIVFIQFICYFSRFHYSIAFSIGWKFLLLGKRLDIKLGDILSITLCYTVIVTSCCLSRFRSICLVATNSWWSSSFIIPRFAFSYSLDWSLNISLSLKRERTRTQAKANMLGKGYRDGRRFLYSSAADDRCVHKTSKESTFERMRSQRTCERGI